MMIALHRRDFRQRRWAVRRASSGEQQNQSWRDLAQFGQNMARLWRGLLNCATGSSATNQPSAGAGPTLD